MTFGEHRDAGFGWSIAEWRDSDRDTVNALDELATGYGLDITEWEAGPFTVDDSAMNGQRYQRFALREEMLKRGLAYIKTLQPKPWNSRAKKQLTENESKALAAWVAEYNRNYGIDTQAQRLAEAENGYKIAVATVDTQLRKLTKRRRGMGKETIATDIKALTALLDEGFYSLKSIDNDCVSFFTRPIFLSEVQKKAKVELHANLGEFVVNVGFQSSNVWIDGHRNNLWVDKHPHPHINGGTLCLGSAWDQLEKLTKNGDTVAILRLYQLCLHHYNPGNCYVGLECFVEAARKRDAKLRGEKEPPPLTITQALRDAQGATAPMALPTAHPLRRLDAQPPPAVRPSMVPASDQVEPFSTRYQIGPVGEGLFRQEPVTLQSAGITVTLDDPFVDGMPPWPPQAPTTDGLEAEIRARTREAMQAREATALGGISWEDVVNEEDGDDGAQPG